MSKSLIVLLSLLALPVLLMAQLYPKEGSKLNYRIVGFSFPAIPHVKKYTIEIAAGNYDNEGLFKKNVTQSQDVKNNKSILEIPSFNTQYTWRVIYKTDGAKVPASELHHFSTGFVPAVDTGINRLRVTVAAKQYKDAFVFIDVNGVMYDMNGKPVWYLPHLPGTKENVQPRDLKLSPFGTITLLNGPEIYEIDYNGNVLWAKTDNKSVNSNKQNTGNSNYHHEFTRLQSGHYMALGTQDVLFRFPHTANDDLSVFPENNTQINRDTSLKKGTCGYLAEYDDKGKAIWVWNVYKYILTSDLIYLFSKTGRNFDLHDNAFFFDETNKHIYISFKNINRVIEIQYPEGNVINTYGKIFDKDMIVSGGLRAPATFDDDNGAFCLQHACKRSQKGYLYMFDNNCDPNGCSKILMIDPHTTQDQMKVVWEYDCDKPAGHKPMQQISGGNVIELPNQSLFVSMDMQYDKLFIVTPGKEILWSAVYESFDKTKQVWHMNPSYRSSIITTSKDLEQMIWNSEKE